MNILAASTSTLFNDTYLNYLRSEIEEIFLGCNNVIFIPYARPGGMTWDSYTAYASSFFEKLNIPLRGIHSDNPAQNIEEADGFFTGGGNTFVLLKTLQEQNLLVTIMNKIKSGTPYLGTSAGSNIVGQTIKTTNDMPIVEPADFNAMGIFPFNINPHYQDPIEGSKHMGETRETRIKEYLEYNDITVVGLREGSFIRQKGDRIWLGGKLEARIFKRGLEPFEISAGSRLNGI